jgi:hypothetical protein
MKFARTYRDSRTAAKPSKFSPNLGASLLANKADELRVDTIVAPARRRITVKRDGPEIEIDEQTPLEDDPIVGLDAKRRAGHNCIGAAS